ncbi:hypothetical protein TRVL_01852 [Trypanosoma vivax]|uniref:Uncharacterized protein n=1 Tax=Trypanosoma vivax (strain Y486) TaxID=1055687 RepID=G0UBT8_TRYVY|nr:hypothetical protein TRVL_01852 [Trypanosoma vivax]CCC53286.1 hypothetical protein TVY486_1107700 [Trypanosoma vivax Y486]
MPTTSIFSSSSSTREPFTGEVMVLCCNEEESTLARTLSTAPPSRWVPVELERSPITAEQTIAILHPLAFYSCSQPPHRNGGTNWLLSHPSLNHLPLTKSLLMALTHKLYQCGLV